MKKVYKWDARGGAKKVAWWFYPFWWMWESRKL
jgi:hypothetical protein